MLKINDLDYSVLESTIKFIDATHHTTKGYSVLVSLDISLNDVSGYISFYVDFFNEKDIKLIENKTYVENLSDLDSKILMLEIYDTFQFVDFVDNEMKVEFGSIEEDKIGINLSINDESIKLEYDGLLSIE